MDVEFLREGFLIIRVLEVDVESHKRNVSSMVPCRQFIQVAA